LEIGTTAPFSAISGASSLIWSETSAFVAVQRRDGLGFRLLRKSILRPSRGVSGKRLFPPSGQDGFDHQPSRPVRAMMVSCHAFFPFIGLAAYRV